MIVTPPKPANQNKPNQPTNQTTDQKPNQTKIPFMSPSMFLKIYLS